MSQRGVMQRGRRGARGPAGLLGGRYAFRSLVGEGGMAEVFSALDSVLERPVAVKVLREGLAHDPAAVARFRREARAVAAVSHPNIVAIHDVGEVEHDEVVDGRFVSRGRPFLITELIVGQPLDAMLRRDGPLPAQRVAEIGESVAAALAFAHGSGIVHRDLKPANVMLTPWGHVKVLDFGIALAAAWTPTTEGGKVHGTAEYLSPEQARGWPVDGRSDIYSLGVVLYELLTGRVPFVGENPVAVAYQHLERLPERPSRLRPDTPPELERVIMRCLEKDPRQRYESAGAVRAALRHVRRGSDPGRTAAVRPGADATAPVGTMAVAAIAPPPPVPVAPSAVPTVPHHAARQGATAVDPLGGEPPGRGRRRRSRRWGRGIGITVILLLAVAAAVVVPSFFRSAPVAKGSPPHHAPVAPVGVTAKASCVGFAHVQVNLQWDAVNTEEVTGYVVYRVDIPDTWPIAVAQLHSRGATSFLDRTLKPGDSPTY
ncbi:MAG TPA: protein kinase, partial [Actinomycetota bacterium]|nr:protein kinase [Actinomycetota bacterium]